MVDKLPAKQPGKEFFVWLDRVIEIGCSYEIVIEDGYISRVYIKEPDDRNWENVKFGRVFGTKMLSFKQRVFMPRKINGKFIADYNGK